MDRTQSSLWFRGRFAEIVTNQRGFARTRDQRFDLLMRNRLATLDALDHVNPDPARVEGAASRLQNSPSGRFKSETVSDLKAPYTCIKFRAVRSVQPKLVSSHKAQLP